MMTGLWNKGNMLGPSSLIKYLAFFVFVTTLFCVEGSVAAPEVKDNEVSEEAILFFGDSITAGYGVEVDAAYPARLQQIGHTKSKSFDLINAGLSGDTTAGGIRRLAFYLDKNFTIFFLALGANDGLRGLSPQNMEQNLRKIINQVKEVKPEVKIVLAGMEAPPNMGVQYANDFRQAFHRLAAEFNLTFIPFLLDGVAADKDLNLPDGIHPNEKGHQAIANTVWSFIENLL